MEAVVGPVSRPWGERWVRFFAPSHAVTPWHISPGIDLGAYAFSWVFMAVPMVWLLGRDHPYAFWVFIVSTVITDLHRHYTLPYVYLDGSVRESYPLRFWFLPALFFALWTQSPSLARSVQTLGPIEAGAIVAWIVFTVQLLRQDRGGAFALRVALPCYLMSIAASSLVGAWVARPSAPVVVGQGGLSIAAAGWLGSALVGSLVLHCRVARDAPGDAWAGRRTHWVFPASVSLVSLVAGWNALAPSAVSSPGAAPLSVRSVVNLVLITFLLWHVYHVLMQKYGILRIYSAKSGHADKVPGWVDRVLLGSFLPLFFVWFGGYEFETITQRLALESGGLDGLAAPTLGFLATHFLPLMGVAGVWALASVGAFVCFEWRVHRFRNLPRLCFAGGTLLFYLSFFYLGLVNFYAAFSFAHGVEYMAFIWAFQRRRYQERNDARAPLLRVLVAHPFLFYAGLSVVVIALVACARYQQRFPVLAAVSPRELFGETAFEWIRWYTVYQGILHFYYDGFLWKMRRPELRRQM